MRTTRPPKPSDLHYQTTVFSVTGTKFEEDDPHVAAAEEWPRCTGLQSYYRTRVPKWLRAVENERGWEEKLDFVPKRSTYDTYKE
jgi:hypothetical protein